MGASKLLSIVDNSFPDFPRVHGQSNLNCLIEIPSRARMKGVSDLSDSAPIRTRCPHPSEREHPFFTPNPAEKAENDFPG